MGEISYLERKKNLSLIYFSELRDVIIENRIKRTVPRNKIVNENINRTLDEF